MKTQQLPNKISTFLGLAYPERKVGNCYKLSLPFSLLGLTCPERKVDNAQGGKNPLSVYPSLRPHYAVN